MRFKVTWVIDLDEADVTVNPEYATPELAALEALRIQRDPYSIATVFSVEDTITGETKEIDCEELQNLAGGIPPILNETERNQD